MARRTQAKSVDLTFEDAHRLRDLFGVHDRHLRLLEQRLGVHVAARGSVVHLTGADDAVEKGGRVLVKMYGLLKDRPRLEDGDIEQALRLLAANPAADVAALFTNGIPIVARRRTIVPKGPGQKLYVEAIRQHALVFGIGPAGTGKTYLAMAMAIASLMRREFERIVLTRPAVEAGEKLGFLPGNMVQKVDPYLRPLFDALHDMMELDHARRWIDEGVIEIAPLAFMRGRTLDHSFVILDEAQNCTPEQMKMFLTRQGRDSKAVVTGDVTQIDLPRATHSGLVEASAVLRDVAGIAIVYLTEADVVRHPLVEAIIRAYADNGTSGAKHGR